MHHTKRAARSLAWRDPNNPFAKSMYRKRTSSALNRMEEGHAEDESDLIRITTDDPSNYRAKPTGTSTDHSPQNQTAPSALSRRRDHEAGDEIGHIPATISPEGSIKDFSPTTQNDPSTNHNEKNITKSDVGSAKAFDTADGDESHKKAGFVKWITSWSSHESDKSKDENHSAEDDNGKNKPSFTVWNQIKRTIFNSKINILLVMCPVGIAIHFVPGLHPAVPFVTNFVAIIPLAAMLSFATEEIALRVGEVLGGLLNASFGNAVELIVSIIALVQGEILIVQTSLIGSILSNLLLVLGMCFFAGGVNRIEQEFNMTVAQTAASLLFLAVSSLLIPTAFDLWATTGEGGTEQNNTEQVTPSGTPVLAYGVQQLSLATAVLLLFVYALFLFFQLKSHNSMYTAPSKKNEKRDLSKHKARVKRFVPNKMRRRSQAPTTAVTAGASVDATTPTSSRASIRSSDNANNELEEEEPQLSLWVAIFTLAASTVLVALNAEFLVSSIDQLTCGGAISKTFVGLILLPIVGNAAEHATSVTVAIKDKMDLAIGVAVGSSMQIALLVLPFMVVLGQIIGQVDMTLYFDGFQLAILFVTVLLVNYLIQDGKSHWLEGVLLMILYIIIAVAAWYYPTRERPGETCG